MVGTRVCILVRAEPGQVKKVLDAARGIAGVEEAWPCFGRYDIIVLASPRDYESARELSRMINALRGVKSTETLVES